MFIVCLSYVYRMFIVCLSYVYLPKQACNNTVSTQNVYYVFMQLAWKKFIISILNYPIFAPMMCHI